MSDSTFIGRYQIQQQLGKKAGRRTLLAKDPDTEQSVVVKLLLFSHEFEWDDLKLFEREAETLRSLSHPSIPSYIDSFEVETPEGKGFALVQTYIEARSLDEHLKAGRSFAESDLKQLANDLLEILQYLHGRQPAVVHRDIKPSNILLGDRSGNSPGQVYLVDFGSVQTLAASKGGTITVVGTYGYMPPEQFGGRATPASDLYSLGATLIYLASGKHPADLPQQDLRLDFEKQVSLSRELVKWLKRMVEPSLNRRFSSAEEASQVLNYEPSELTRSPMPFLAPQPFGSKILLKKTRSEINLLLPPLSPTQPVDGKFSLFSFLIPSCALTYALVTFLPFSSILLIFGSLGGSFILTLLNLLLARKRISINRKRVSFRHELTRQFALYERFWPTQQVSKIVYAPGQTQISARKRELVKVQPKLVLWLGTRSLNISEMTHLSEPELQWLAQELSDWLQIPISGE
ncbi:MAG: serine/threonine protein kinase [Oculatellaceae cyanobacterium Prado106]|nr:serine/threonine protein kinase [Oculatellaceae cyanobacterium Prado106]